MDMLVHPIDHPQCCRLDSSQESLLCCDEKSIKPGDNMVEPGWKYGSRIEIIHGNYSNMQKAVSQHRNVRCRL